MSFLSCQGMCAGTCVKETQIDQLVTKYAYISTKMMYNVIDPYLLKMVTCYKT